jgi:hypothetical protein
MEKQIQLTTTLKEGEVIAGIYRVDKIGSLSTIVTTASVFFDKNGHPTNQRVFDNQYLAALKLTSFYA